MTRRIVSSPVRLPAPIETMRAAATTPDADVEALPTAAPAATLEKPTTKAAATTAPSTPTSTTDEPTLKLGAKGCDVSALQQQLKELGYPLYMTGELDKQTAAALQRWQKANGVEGSGELDATSRAQLMKPSAGLAEAQALAGETAALIGERALEYAEMPNGAKPPGVSTAKNLADFRCARWVHGAIEDAGVDITDGLDPAYKYGDALAADPQFKEVKVSRAELERLPPGAVVVWGKGDNQKYGHVGVVTSKANEKGQVLQASDRAQPLSAFSNASDAKKYGTDFGSGTDVGGNEFRVFIPLDAPRTETAKP
jgi:peptidoglycan hydrolase-like protein with peptidoglycan-binding domain